VARILLKLPEGNKDVSEVALDGLSGHTMRAAEEGAPGLGRGKGCLGPILHQISVGHMSFSEVEGWNCTQIVFIWKVCY
jgi:hypothetical protein